MVKISISTYHVFWRVHSLLLWRPAKRLSRKACRSEIKCGDTLQRDSRRAGQSQSRAWQRQPMGSESGRSQRPLHTYITFCQAAHRGSIAVALFSVSTNLHRNKVKLLLSFVDCSLQCILVCGTKYLVFFSLRVTLSDVVPNVSCPFAHLCFSNCLKYKSNQLLMIVFIRSQTRRYVILSFNITKGDVK